MNMEKEKKLEKMKEEIRILNQRYNEICYIRDLEKIGATTKHIGINEKDMVWKKRNRLVKQYSKLKYGI